ncbi:Acyltransferase family protein [Vibrio aerogenes CECT 7868]|uniref:Acyltransferase family protein n=1 Tax=Vibrio aerogenes CECT 7868 TaxID=1216006 RepID=A0A1M5V797_9VIBR|nr:acyltransferase [Vibrio aerogenes]SHH71096.1 Acyltransferase family protein [Vibrio aerogenes CECT 7868]
MTHLLADYTRHKDNNFNLIRFIAASLVLFSHGFALTGHAEPLSTSLHMTWGSIAVDIFFITSGFLITGSYLNRNHLLHFTAARFLRIYPALLAAIGFCIVTGAMLTPLSLPDYLANGQTHEFILKNMTLFSGAGFLLPGVFTDLPFPYVVNASLWTLPYEVWMYAILALLMIMTTMLNRYISFLSMKRVFLVVASVAIMTHIVHHFLPAAPAAPASSSAPPVIENFIRMFSMFFAGAALYIWRDKIYLSATWLYGGLCVLLLCAFWQQDVFFVIYCLILPLLLLMLAYLPNGRIRSFNRFGDYSYGIYIYAFPVQQLIATWLPGVSVPVMAGLSFVLTLMLAMISWHLIEKKALRMKMNAQPARPLQNT